MYPQHVNNPLNHDVKENEETLSLTHMLLLAMYSIFLNPS